jgi:hypothetical protein
LVPAGTPLSGPVEPYHLVPIAHQRRKGLIIPPAVADRVKAEDGRSRTFARDRKANALNQNFVRSCRNSNICSMIHDKPHCGALGDIDITL